MFSDLHFSFYVTTFDHVNLTFIFEDLIDTFKELKVTCHITRKFPSRISYTCSGRSTCRVKPRLVQSHGRVQKRRKSFTCQSWGRH